MLSWLWLKRTNDWAACQTQIGDENGILHTMINGFRSASQPRTHTEQSVSLEEMLAGKIQDIKNTLANHEQQIDYFENQSRWIEGYQKKGVRLGMTPKVSGLLLQLTWSFFAPDWACPSHWTCQSFFWKHIHRPRSIIAEMGSCRDKEAVLRNTEEQKITGVNIIPDFLASVSWLDKELHPQVPKMRREGQDIYHSFDKIRYCESTPRQSVPQSTAGSTTCISFPSQFGPNSTGINQGNGQCLSDEEWPPMRADNRDSSLIPAMKLMNILEVISKTGHPAYIMGDLNVDLIKHPWLILISASGL